MPIIRMQCLQKCTFPFSELNRDWKGDKRYPEQAIQRFITFNREIFSFLGVSASLDEVNYEKVLTLSASNYVGAAPLRMPSTGKYYADIQISTRFGENLSELVYLLKDTLEPNYLNKKLQDADQLRAPLYFDCVNYFSSFLRAIPELWSKFDTVTKEESHPCSSTNWSKYSLYSVNPNNSLKFENRKNILSREHKEWLELTYVLSLALREFESFKTPLLMRQRYFSVVSRLKRYINEHKYTAPLTNFQIHPFDPVKIKVLKENANKFLEHNTVNDKAWRIDSAELFERYVQYVLTRIGKICGVHVISNHKFPVEGAFRPAWALRYLEPDVILHKENTFLFADAKYKAHMLNTRSSSDILKESFRSDLHQVLAYSSLDASKNKATMLLYPCDRFKRVRIEAVNRVESVRNEIFLVGIPFTTVGLDECVSKLSKILRQVFSKADSSAVYDLEY